MSDAHVLYRFYSSAGDLLYIGVTCKPPNRFAQHRKDKDWWSEVGNISIANYASREELLSAERAAIRSERPKYNVVHNGHPVPQGTLSPRPTSDDAMVGKYFHTTRVCGHGARIAAWQGKVVGQPSPDVLLIQLYEWVIGEPNGQELITLADFMAKSPVLYDSADDWRFGYEYGVLAHSHRCRRPDPAEKPVEASA